MYRHLQFSLFLLFYCGSSFANDGDQTFQSSQVHEIRMIFWQTAFWDSLLATHANDTTMPCLVNIDGITMDTIGVKLKGNSSFNSYPGVKKSFKLSFDAYNDTNRFDGLHTLNLNNGFKDPTMLREKLVLDFLRSQGLPAPRCTFAKVYLNNTYWGLYSMVEEVDKTFLNDLIGNKDGNLFKGDPQGSLQWYGSADSSYYNKYELHTNDSINDWSDLVRLIKIINNSGASFQDSLETILNTNNAIGQWAVDLLFANLDSYTGSGHNYYLYHNTASNKFERIAWDVNESFGNFNQGMNIAQLEDLSYAYVPQPSNNSRPLNIQMLATPQYREQLTDKLCYFIQNAFRPDLMNPRIDSLASSIRSAYYADPNKMFTNQNFEDNLNQNISANGTPGGSNIAGLKSFIANRRVKLQGQLAALGCVINELEPNIDRSEHIIIYPNPCSSQSMLTVSSSTVCELSLFDVLGHMIISAKISAGVTEIQLTNIDAGLYHYQVTYADGRLGNGKIVITE